MMEGGKDIHMFTFNWEIVPWHSILVILSAGLAGFLIGLTVERVVLRRFAKFAAKTKWQGDDIVIAGLHGYVTYLGILLGFLAGLAGAGLTSPASDTLRKALVAAVILTITLAAARIVSDLVTLRLRRSVGADQSLSIVRNIVWLVLLVLGLLMILDFFGVAIAPVLTALGVGGLAVALALQDTLSNLFAGIQIIGSNKVKPGDYIKLDSGQEGYVTDVTWRYTTMRALANNLIIVPNSKLAAALVTNYHRPSQDLAVLVNLGVAYESDLEKVEKVTIEVAADVMKTVQGGVPDFQPFIRYNKFGDSSIGFSVIMRGKEYVDQYLITHEFVKRLQKRYQQEKISIPFPQRTVQLHIEDGMPLGSASDASGNESDKSRSVIR
jgi:small-conductance mechanosensitive channel